MLIAETGGQNALIVDSTALTEQVVGDVLASAFDSAGQRCSALRVLYLQEDIADRTIAMLKGGMDELAVGNPARLATDIGPVIDAEAQAGLLAHIERMGKVAKWSHQTPVARRRRRHLRAADDAGDRRPRRADPRGVRAGAARAALSGGPACRR